MHNGCHTCLRSDQHAQLLYTNRLSCFSDLAGCYGLASQVLKFDTCPSVYGMTQHGILDSAEVEYNGRVLGHIPSQMYHLYKICGM